MLREVDGGGVGDARLQPQADAESFLGDRDQLPFRPLADASVTNSTGASIQRHQLLVVDGVSDAPRAVRVPADVLGEFDARQRLLAGCRALHSQDVDASHCLVLYIGFMLVRGGFPTPQHVLELCHPHQTISEDDLEAGITIRAAERCQI